MGPFEEQIYSFCCYQDIKLCTRHAATRTQYMYSSTALDNPGCAQKQSLQRFFPISRFLQLRNSAGVFLGISLSHLDGGTYLLRKGGTRRTPFVIEVQRCPLDGGGELQGEIGRRSTLKGPAAKKKYVSYNDHEI
ncbi:hypothetical protein NQZ68_034136 [Dissostichus eleginoides]|nr:hypothetical protein NQZ68_034136 [Dissostichus eleginoides]